MKIIRKIIRVDGTEVPIDGPKTIAEIEKLIGADCLDHVNLADRVHVMFVDDIGISKNLPVNEKATELYLQRCLPGTTHKMRGDVVIVPDSDFGGR